MSDAGVGERQLLEETLRSPWADFIAKFMAARSLHALLRHRPQLACQRTIDTLAAVLADPVTQKERQALFLFREAAGGLLALFVAADRVWADKSGRVLHQVLRHGAGAVQRAVNEALASLPLALAAPPVATVAADGEPPAITWAELLQAVGGGACGELGFVGRSLVGRLADNSGLLVVKLARPDDRLDALTGEAVWLGHLRDHGYCFPVPFAIPQPVVVNGDFAFRLRELPICPPANLALHGERFAISFIAPPDYYRYPNEPAVDPDLDFDRFRRLMAENAHLLGFLTGRGIVHEAVIPLFHNRVQSQRREDSGLYNWVLAGRLDRWLESCRHPNFGLTGLRDFEHFVRLDDLRCTLYYQLGAHFLSLLLVAGSYFRSREPALRGCHGDGRPVDARHLFDAGELATVVEEVYRNYYQGFAGVPCLGPLPFDLVRLTERMIDEMGVDRHMDEVLRLVDQQSMDDAAFVAFLEARGFSRRQCARLERGVADINIPTGPHLGGFNQPISLPELVEAVGAMGAMCVVGRYLADQGSTVPWQMEEQEPEFAAVGC
ncbi:MAG: SidJ-related pseudokinase [Desulfobulbaceae bacterium]|nr:SidJ-related pseudokinase [Desulfobulbaceae bacterium]